MEMKSYRINADVWEAADSEEEAKRKLKGQVYVLDIIEIEQIG